MTGRTHAEEVEISRSKRQRDSVKEIIEEE